MRSGPTVPAGFSVPEGSKLGGIWAQARGGAIGKDGTMPWHVPEDMRFFVAVTTGHPVIMGRATWESIPEAFRPFRNRTNIVLTRDSGFRAEGALVAHDPQQALDLAASAPGGEQIWCVGGAQVYALYLPAMSRVRVTELDHDVVAPDAFAPRLGAEWDLQGREPSEGFLTSSRGMGYRFLDYRRA